MSASRTVERFIRSGYDCIVREMLSDSIGNFFCGYVGVPLDHIVVTNRELLDEINVHGGVTFADYAKFGYENRLYIGFSCNHCEDCRSGEKLWPYQHYWTLEETKDETKRLADKLRMMSVDYGKRGKLEGRLMKKRLNEYGELLTMDEVAAVLSVHVATARAMCNRGQLPSTRIGRRMYVSNKAMREYVEKAE